jgi:CMP-N,N'-diacetyllegionaminic acid synthase
MKSHCVILARGGSKGLPNKNIKKFCGKPLIYWTISQSLNSKCFEEVWVSSDSDKILQISKKIGANIIKRPKKLSNDSSSSEAAWLHALQFIEKKFGKIDIFFSPQVTSPIRESKDIADAIKIFKDKKLDSLFSSNTFPALTLWQEDNKSKLNSINYDYKNRSLRQFDKKQYIENGSFYMFTPQTLLKYNNRFGKKIGYSIMDFWKMFEIDNISDFKLCELIMKKYLIK